MPVPNHMAPLDLTDQPGTNPLVTHRFPLLHLAKPESKHSSEAAGLAFVDDVYGMTRWVDRDISAPPTWMDPEIFVRMVVTDERVIEFCQEYVRLRRRGSTKPLRELVADTFSEVYLVYMFEQFESVTDLIVEWIIAHFAQLKAEE